MMQSWNLQLLDLYDAAISFVLVAITTLLGLSPYEFSDVAYNLSRTVSSALVGVGVALVVLFFITDLAGTAVTLKVKDKDEVLKHFVMLLLGVAIVRGSSWLMFYIFTELQVIWQTILSVTMPVGAGLDGSLYFTGDTWASSLREMIEADGSTPFWDVMGHVESVLLFIFLLTSLLGVGGMLLSVLLVPIAIFIELYIYAAFAPIPLSTLASSQRQIAIGYLKVFAGVCIRAAVMMFGISLSAAIISSDAFNLSDFAAGTVVEGFLVALVPVMQLVVSIMILQKAVKSAQGFANTLVGANSIT